MTIGDVSTHSQALPNQPRRANLSRAIRVNSDIRHRPTRNQDQCCSVPILESQSKLCFGKETNRYDGSKKRWKHKAKVVRESGRAC